MLWSIDSCQYRASADQYHLAISQAQVSTHWGRVFFEVIRWQVTSFQRVAGSSLFFLKKFILNMLWLCHYGPPWSRIGHALRPIFMLCLVKIFKVSSCGKLCIVLKLVYFDSWSWESFVSTCDFFNFPFPLHVQNEKQLLSRVFVFVFHFAWCVRGFKSLKRFWSYLIAGLPLARSARGTEPHTHGIWSTSFRLVVTWLTERTYVRTRLQIVRVG